MDEGRTDVGAGITLVQQPVDHPVVGLELLRFERRAYPFEEHVGPGLFHFIERRQALPPDPQLRPADHALEFVDLLARHKRERPARTARATRPSDPVGVILRVIGQVEVEHHLKVVHVEPARRHVGRDQEFELPLAEFLHHPRALRLGKIAVEPVDRVPARMQELVEVIDHDLRTAKDDTVAEVMHIDQPGERLELRAPVDLEVHLFDLRRVLRLRLNLEPRRIAAVATDEILDRTRHRRREEQQLPLLRHGGQDFLDVVAKTHVEHAVRLVEHDEFQRVESQRPAIHVIHHAARRADHDLHAGLEGAKLPVVALSAVDRHLAHALLEERQLPGLLGDLHRQFARWAEDQHLNDAARGVDALDGRDREGRGLARARGGLTHDITAGQGHRNHGGLDRRGLLKPHLGDGFQDLGGHT